MEAQRMTNIIDHDWLISNGFVEYDVPIFDSPGIDHFYQKCYKDDFGKKYFIDVRHYKIHHPTTFEDLSGYEVSSQLYLKDSHDAVNMTFLVADIDEIEEFIDRLFDNNMLDYYEVWS